MADLDLFRQEVYERLGRILEEKGDEGFILEGPKIVSEFYSKHPGFFEKIETLPAIERYTRKKVICDDGKHAVRCMEWAPDSKSPIHEHGGRPCFDIVLSGELEIIDFDPKKVEGTEDEYELIEIHRYDVKVGEFVIIHPQKTGNELHAVFFARREEPNLFTSIR